MSIADIGGSDEVIARYDTLALTAPRAVTCCTGDQCCSASPGADSAGFGAGLYTDADRDGVPIEAVRASLGSGNPLAAIELREGLDVVDLGCGGGIDVILAARRVGVTGTVYGVDASGNMVELARANAERAGVTNVEILRARIEKMPLPDGCVDVAIANCVLNLPDDKRAVFAEIHRLVRSGGRIVIADPVADDRLTPADLAARGDRAGCIAGALTVTGYRDHLTAAGFTDAEITTTHQIGDGVHAAIVRAARP
jgi:arsenite methyltransferase